MAGKHKKPPSVDPSRVARDKGAEVNSPWSCRKLIPL